MDIATLPLNVLRSRIAIVPQEPFIFAGSIRENLDPSELHLDSSIWNVINQCLATPFVQQLGGLNAELTTRGSNLSTGQKQLLCLARALLKNSKVSKSQNCLLFAISELLRAFRSFALMKEPQI